MAGPPGMLENPFNSHRNAIDTIPFEGSRTSNLPKVESGELPQKDEQKAAH